MKKVKSTKECYIATKMCQYKAPDHHNQGLIQDIKKRLCMPQSHELENP